MKLLEIFRFEFSYQIRRPWPWLALIVLLVFSYENTRSGMVPATLPEEFIINSPFIVTVVTIFSCMIWLLVSSAMAGEAAARDVQTGMYPLMYTSPVRKTEYLMGRFAAAFALNAFVLLGVQAGNLLGVYAGGVDPEIIGPLRPASYLSAYGFVALPNAFIVTAIQFAVALFSGRVMAGYLASMGLIFLSVPVTVVFYYKVGPAVGRLLDPIGMMAIMNEMMSDWTIVEKNIRMFRLEGNVLVNRVLWLSIALATLLLIHWRFRFEQRTTTGLLSRFTGRTAVKGLAPTSVAGPRVTHHIPDARQSFGFTMHMRQSFSVAASSFRMIATSPAGLFLLFVFPLFVVLVLLNNSHHWQIPLLPRTGFIVTKFLTGPLTYVQDFRVMVPLLIVYFAGELVWRERDARLSENVDATSVPDWVLFFGKFGGLGFVLSAFMISLTLAGILAQVIMGYHDFRVDIYLELLLGLQLPEYLIFAALCFAIHAVVNQKHVAMLISLVAFVCMVFAPQLGVENKLFIYGAGPWWNFTDMRGFASTLGPWLWFKLYWAAWALLLAVIARLSWVRGRESGLVTRLRIARARLTPAAVGAGVLAGVLVVTLGGFIFYNTNVLNEFVTAEEHVERRAEYEKRYGRYEGIPQPKRVATNLRIEIYPDRRAATIRGSYRLINRDASPIASVHLEPAFYVKTNVTFDRAARQVIADQKLGHFIYQLDEPLQPGDSVTLNFSVEFETRGFRPTGLGKNGASMAILENGTYFAAGALPVIGYQPMRELWSSDDRRKHGLPRQLTLAIPGDINQNVSEYGAATFDAIIGTSDDQVAVAPGELRRTWSESGRRYFHYASDVPINGTEVFFSADYAVHRERWKDVDVQVYLHPGHVEHRERLLRSVRASLDYFSEQFGQYPYRFLQVVEQPGNFFGMGVDGSGVITGGEGFFQLDPQGDGFDGIFEIVAHEMGHLWWGMQLKAAWAEGGGVISEGLAWYSAMQLVKHEQGTEALYRFMRFMRRPDQWQPIRTGRPLLRAMDPWANYRKAPYAFLALSEYIGEERVNGALRSLIEKKRNSLATTLDMYRELQAATPDSMQYLLRDLFATNTIWDLSAEQASAVQNRDGSWKVSLNVKAKKVVADSAGVETELAMDEPIPVGVFEKSENNFELSKPLYLQMHRIRSGEQTITINVPRQPVLAGIDPHHVLDWVEDEDDNNIASIKTPERRTGAGVDQ